jgi:hypothetical protein
MKVSCKRHATDASRRQEKLLRRSARGASASTHLEALENHRQQLLHLRARILGCIGERRVQRLIRRATQVVLARILTLRRGQQCTRNCATNNGATQNEGA